MTWQVKDQPNSKLKLCLTVKEMAEKIGIGINAAYQLANSEGFPVIRFSKRKIRIPVEGLELWLLKQTKRIKEIKDD